MRSVSMKKRRTFFQKVKKPTQCINKKETTQEKRSLADRIDHYVIYIIKKE